MARIKLISDEVKRGETSLSQSRPRITSLDEILEKRRASFARSLREKEKSEKAFEKKRRYSEQAKKRRLEVRADSEGYESPGHIDWTSGVRSQVEEEQWKAGRATERWSMRCDSGGVRSLGEWVEAWGLESVGEALQSLRRVVKDVRRAAKLYNSSLSQIPTQHGASELEEEWEDLQVLLLERTGSQESPNRREAP